LARPSPSLSRSLPRAHSRQLLLLIFRGSRPSSCFLHLGLDRQWSLLPRAPRLATTIAGAATCNMNCGPLESRFAGWSLTRKEGKERRKEGRKEGREEGRKEGTKEGRKEGRREGGREGRKEGRKEGGKRGRKEERREGRKEERNERWKRNGKKEKSPSKSNLHNGQSPA